MSTQFGSSKRWASFSVLLLLFLAKSFEAACASSEAAKGTTVSGEFVGNSPCGETIQQLLRIPLHTNSDIIRWRVMLLGDGKSSSKGEYELSCEYGPAVANTPGSVHKGKLVKRKGTWKISNGIRSNPSAVVCELQGAVSFYKVDENILQILNPDRSLMVGNDGWSYTLNRSEASEKPGALIPAGSPATSYTIAPLSKGPGVFGIFEGRTPCEGIARELKLPAHGPKAKWLITLYQNAETGLPTTYKAEGTLFREKVRTGNWSIIRGARKESIIYQLGTAETQPPLLLLKGDDNVIFFLSQERIPLVGNADFSYTLNRNRDL